MNRYIGYEKQWVSREFDGVRVTTERVIKHDWTPTPDPQELSELDGFRPGDRVTIADAPGGVGVIESIYDAKAIYVTFDGDIDGTIKCWAEELTRLE